jgi:signal transduction histidine kinase
MGCAKVTEYHDKYALKKPIPKPAALLAATRNFSELVFSMVHQASGKRANTSFVFLFLFSVFAAAHHIPPPTIQDLTLEANDLYLSDPDKAILLTQEALRVAREANDPFHEAYCHLLFSKIYWVKANYKLSTEYGFKALKFFKASPHYRELGACLLSLARTVTELGNSVMAHKFIHDAIALAHVHSSDVMLADAYREHSFLSTETNALDSAIIYSDMGIALFEKLRDSLDISILYGRKARIYFQMKQYESSRKYAYYGLTLDSLVGNRRALGISYYQVAQNEHALGNVKRAIAQLKQSIHISSEIGNLNWQIRAHEFLSSLYIESNMPELAAAELLTASKYKDDLYNAEKNGQIQEMQSLHELDTKETTIQLLEQENALQEQEVKNQRLFLALLLVTVSLLVLLIFVLTRLRAIQHKANRNLASKNAAIEQQRISIQQQAESLHELNQLKTKLFSVISHDLRGPIANLQSLLDLFTKKLMTAEEFVTLSTKLKDNLNVTQRTLENLLNWSFSQMGGIKTEKKRIEIKSSIAEVCQLMEEMASRKDIQLDIQNGEPLYVWADEDQLQVILRNLIQNAIKFSGFNDTIRIGASRENGQCQVSVKDSGIGMTAAEIESLAGSRQHFSKSGTHAEKGTGLGLLLCKEFVTRNGGEITIRSAVGEGTEVSFSLMLAEGESALVQNPAV